MRQKQPKKCGVYLILSPTKRAYVGVSSNLRQRYSQYKNLNCEFQLYLCKSLNKYGFGAHEFIELEVFEEEKSREELSKLEEFYYWYIKSLGFPLMNIRLPGYNGKASEEMRAKRRGKNHFNWGKRGSEIPTSKPISQFSMDGVHIKDWECISAAGDELGINKAHISQCCLGRYLSINSFRWAYLGKKPFYINEDGKKAKRIKETGTNEQRCYQYNKNGNFIAEFPSVNEASDSTGIGRAGIILTSLKQLGNKSAGGYMWFYEYKGEKTTPYNQRDYYKTAGAAKKIYQYALDGKFIAEFSGAAEAHRQIGITYRGIMKVARGEQKSTNDYIFTYSKLEEFAQ